MGFVNDYCPDAEEYYSKEISLPMYPALSFEQQDYVIEALKTAVKKVS